MSEKEQQKCLTKKKKEGKKGRWKEQSRKGGYDEMESTKWEQDHTKTGG